MTLCFAGIYPLRYEGMRKKNDDEDDGSTCCDVVLVYSTCLSSPHSWISLPKSTE